MECAWNLLEYCSLWLPRSSPFWKWSYATYLFGIEKNRDDVNIVYLCLVGVTLARTSVKVTGGELRYWPDICRPFVLHATKQHKYLVGYTEKIIEFIC